MFTHLFFWPRFLVIHVCSLVLVIVGVILKLGQDKDAPLSPARYKVFVVACKIVAFIFTLNNGLWWEKKRTHVDYSKWLGPDWKPTYEGAGIHIGNHQCYGDITAGFNLLDPFPSFVAKIATRKMFGIGHIMDSMRCLYIKHRGKAGSAESKQAVKDQITEAQIEAEEGKRPPVFMYPEGCSTNGHYMIKFKKGAFASLRAVKPYVYNYWSYRGMVTDGACMHIYMYYIMQLGAVWSKVTCLELPVFCPNDYFWENHWDGKQDKAGLFADTMREIMAEVGGYKLSDATVDDKLDFKKILKGKKIEKKPVVKEPAAEPAAEKPEAEKKNE